MPVLNREQLVLRCLDSVKTQSKKPYELIVVDNGSTDSTVAQVTKWMVANVDSGIKMSILEEKQRGACNARQKGLDNAKGEFVLFFDSDDEMDPELIEKALGEMEKDEKADIICWKCEIRRLDGKRRVPPFDLSDPLENHLIHTLLRPQGYLVRKELIKSAGGWSKPIPVWNDYELGLRLLLKNPAIRGIRKVLATIHAQEDSITGSNFSHKEGQWEKTLEEMRKENHLGNHPKKKQIEDIFTYREVILAAHYYREGNKEAAKRLYENAIKRTSGLQKVLLKLSFGYTRRGGRGAWRFIGNFYL